MQPAPLTGTKKRETRNSSVSCLPFYISACSLTSLFHIDEEGYAVILHGFQDGLNGHFSVAVLGVTHQRIGFVDKQTAVPVFGRDGGSVMQGFADILPRSDTKCRLSLGFPHGRGRTFR